MSPASHDTFELKSVEMMAAWDRKLVVDVYGFREGERIYHDTVRITDKGPITVNLNYADVDDVRVVPVSTAAGAGPGHAKDAALGDIIFGRITGDAAAHVVLGEAQSGGHAAVAAWSPVAQADLAHGVHPIA